jgi:tetratricopeptide (TPR) repeat protein
VPDPEAVGHYERGNRLREQGDLAGAAEEWHAASQGSHHGAALQLGELLFEQGEFDRAEDELSFAAGADDPPVAIRAVTTYGRLISETEFSSETTVGEHRRAKSIGRDTAEADALWRRAAESGEPEAAWAYIGLGRLYDPGELADEPDPTKAEQGFARAAASGHADAGPCALLKLGRLRQNRDRDAAGVASAGAIEALEQGAQSGHPEWAPRCAFQLGAIYANAGDKKATESWWRVAADSGHPDVAEVAHRALFDKSSAMRAGLRSKSGLGRLLGR